MFKYLNIEPQGERLQDCVIRAISLALQLPYYEVVLLLYDNGKFNKCDELCVCCYEKMLEQDFNLKHFCIFDGHLPPLFWCDHCSGLYYAVFRALRAPCCVLRR